MSPEQLRNAGEIDHTSDVWSLGVVAYEALVGQRPFGATTIADLTVRICIDPLPLASSFAPVPHGFDEWFAKACDRDSRARFATASELAEAFRRLLTNDEVIAAPRPEITSIDVSITSTSDHQQSTGPLSRTAHDPPPKNSKRAYWLLASAGVTLVAIAVLRGKADVASPQRPAMSGSQASATTLSGSRRLSAAPEVLDDAGPLEAGPKLEPVPSAAPRSNSSLGAAGGARRPTRPAAKTAPSPASSASSSKFVPDRLYGF